MAYDLGILGGGASGLGAALLAHSRDMSVFLSDYGQLGEGDRKLLIDKNVDFEEGGHSINILSECGTLVKSCLLYTSPSPRDATLSRMPSSA